MNGRYKTELIRQRGPWRAVEQIELATLDYVWWRNNSRLHGEFDMRTPIEAEQAYYVNSNQPNGARRTRLPTGTKVRPIYKSFPLEPGPARSECRG